MAQTNPDVERRIQETVQAVFGIRCAEFSPALREKLRALYVMAHDDGVNVMLGAGFPALTPGQTVEHFESLRDGDLIQNDHLGNQNRARRILNVVNATVMSVLVSTDTGLGIGTAEEFTPAMFQQYGPYKVVRIAA